MKVLGALLISALAMVAAFEEPVPFKDVPLGRKASGRITNGYPAYEGKAPYMVTLLFDNGAGSGWYCGGSVIGHTWVMTAAHCTQGANSVTIGFGALWRKEPQFSHVVYRGDFVQHHAYNTNTLNNDISLIRTPHVDFWSLVNKVELPQYDDRSNYYGSWALLCGWGKTSDTSAVADYLNCVDIQIADNSICEAHYGTTTITPNHVCIATPENKGSCGGDSGGPLVLHDTNRQVGIVSFGSSMGCLSKSPKGMTRVTSFLDWIREITGIFY